MTDDADPEPTAPVKRQLMRHRANSATRASNATTSGNDLAS